MAARDFLFQVFHRGDVSDDMMQQAAILFKENYGVWGEGSKSQGKRVGLSAHRLRTQYMPEGSDCSYVRVTVDGKLAGNAFACRWEHEGDTVCWITQLVVHRDFRRKGLASGLLTRLREGGSNIYGIMSSHPAACLAAAKSFRSSIKHVDLDFIKLAGPIMNASPIEYIKNAQLRGRLFDTTPLSNLISGVDTHFHVDHGEALEALQAIKTVCAWPLGDLPDGHEYLLLLRSRD